MEKIQMEEVEAMEIAIRIYDKIKNYFWVVSFKKDIAGAASWAFGPDKPPKLIPNPIMYWRRPNIEDLVARILAFENNPYLVKQYQRPWER